LSGSEPPAVFQFLQAGLVERFDPAALHTSVYFIAITGRCNCKDTKSLEIKTHWGEKTAKKLQISEKVVIFAT